MDKAKPKYLTYPQWRFKRNSYRKKMRIEKPEILMENPEKVRGRQLKIRYGLTLGEYQVLLDSQNGKCAICGRLPSGKHLPVDHNHTTGKVRGLLCIKCNVALGMVEDNPNLIEAMLNYIKRHT